MGLLSKNRSQLDGQVVAAERLFPSIMAGADESAQFTQIFKTAPPARKYPEPSGTHASCRKRPLVRNRGSKGNTQFTASLDMATTLGRRMVKVDPRLGSLSTRDVAGHYLTEAPADHQAESRATVLARGSRGGLGELLEQLAHLLGRHADAGVATARA
jgi:hypothetical protein